MKIRGVYQNSPSPRIENDIFSKLHVARDRVGTVISKKKDQWRHVVEMRDCTKHLSKKIKCINRAFFKCIELCESIDIVPQTIVNLCEAPGGFTECCTRRFPNAEISAFSMEGDKCITFSPSIRCKYDGLPSGGDVTKKDVFMYFIKMFPDGVDLVTGDGGIQVDANNIEIEEQVCTRLFFAQVIITLSIQKEGGSCFIKFFEGSTKATIDIIKVMNMFYRNVHISKPRTSRMSNSERYLVCNEFVRNDECYLKLKKIFFIMTMSQDMYLYSLIDNDISHSDLQEYEQVATRQISEIELLIESVETRNYDILHSKRAEDEKYLLDILDRFNFTR